jgi:hypothetical protein
LKLHENYHFCFSQLHAPNAQGPWSLYSFSGITPYIE